MPSNPPANTPDNGNDIAPGNGGGPSRATLVLQIVLQALLVIHTIISAAGGGSGC